VVRYDYSPNITEVSHMTERKRQENIIPQELSYFFPFLLLFMSYYKLRNLSYLWLIRVVIIPKRPVKNLRWEMVTICVTTTGPTAGAV